LVAVIVGALAVVAFLQRQAAQGSERQVAATLRANDLATSSRLVLQDDVHLALRLAIESAGATTEFGVVTPEAMDALHWAIQEANIVYPAGDTTPVAVRPGPRNLTGVYALSPNELIALAQSGPVGSYLADQCATYVGTEDCPDPLRSFPAGLSIAAGDQAYGVVQPGPRALAGAKLELVSDFTVSNEDLASELRSFEGLTGIVLSHRAAPVSEELNSRKDSSDPFPDLIMGGYPTQLADWRSDGLIDLSSYLDMSQVRSDFGASQVELGSIDGGYYMVPVASDLKGMVYYPKAAFEAAGYQVPQTWDELLALSHQMVADGRTPWCFAWEDGGGSGWPGTDLLETLVLRVGGTDAYDAWIHHTIPFDAPVIRQAGQMASTLLLTDGFVRGGAGAISSTPVFDSLAPLLEDEPACWMVLQSSLMLTTLPDVNPVVGSSLDWFPFPPIEQGSGVVPQYGGSSYVLAFNDRPEVRAFISHVGSPQWGRVWAATSTTFVSLNDRFDVQQYGAAAGPAPARVLQSIGKTAQEAIAAGVWRYDASDLMPGAIGLFDDNGNPGAFFTGMLDVVDGRKTMDQMLADVERTWQLFGG
jgi:alpha-glucoside transport system substrate-binding protein